MSTLTHFQIRNPKDDETPIEATTQIFSALLPSHFPLYRRLFTQPKTYAFELFLINQTIYFYITTPQETETLITSLVSSSYHKSFIQKTTDPLKIILDAPHQAYGELIQGSSYYLPIKTYSDFSIDPLSTVIGFLAKQDSRIAVGIQVLITPASFAWQKHTIASAQAGPSENGTPPPSMPGKGLGVKKTGYQGGKALVRFVVGTHEKDIALLPILQNLAGTYGAFSLGEGNQFLFRRPLLRKETFKKRLANRTTSYFERKSQIFNAQELATLWHPSGALLKGVKNIAWGRTLAGEPPENLPVSDFMDADAKKEVNFFAKAEYKNKDQIFGIKTPDRRRHVYIMGKTGAGKSTLIANMAIDDIRRDRGIAIIDPHGDLCETVLDFIPKRRLNDVIYLEPFDTERPFSLNVLEVRNAQHKDLVSSGIVSIFTKVWAGVWSARMEYILRNVILTLLDIPNATLVDALTLLSNDAYRKRVVANLSDKVIRDFWEKEFDRMPDRLRAESISPIQNKIGQFVQSRMIRNIIGKEKSSINLQQVMDEGKILLLNLSQGKLGEDNAALLGAMIITQIQLAAMNRSFQKEEDRKDFFLYVDEFQNFATTSFIKILSEARKYRLALTLTNQYIEQLEDEIQRAIFGNVGTIISFVVGARDAAVLSKEFGGLYSDTELVSLGKFEVVMKLSIDNMMTAPFPAKTLPLPSLKNDNREKIIRLSKERYGRKPEPLQSHDHTHEDSASDQTPSSAQAQPRPASKGQNNIQQKGRPAHEQSQQKHKNSTNAQRTSGKNSHPTQKKQSAPAPQKSSERTESKQDSKENKGESKSSESGLPSTPLSGSIKIS